MPARHDTALPDIKRRQRSKNIGGAGGIRLGQFIGDGTDAKPLTGGEIRQELMRAKNGKPLLLEHRDNAGQKRVIAALHPRHQARRKGRRQRIKIRRIKSGTRQMSGQNNPRDSSIMKRLSQSP